MIGAAVRIMVVMLMLGVSGVGDRGAHAAETKPAERLHEAAVTAHRAGRLRQAIELWRDALKLDANWKYAYNLANTLYESGDGKDAWATLERADALQTPEKYAGLVAELRSKVRALLFKDHAWLALEVVPAGARVTLDGVPVEPPFEVWLTTTESTVEAVAEGFVTRTERVKHPLGNRTEVRFALAAARPIEEPARGTLRIDGGPVGARVTMNGVELGALPMGPTSVLAGSAEIVVSHPGYVAATFQVLVRASLETPLTVALKRDVGPSAPNGLATPGWVTLVSGIAVAGIGTGFYLWADSTLDELNALNDPATAVELGFDGYRERYNEVRGALDDRLLASQILFAVGGVAVATGITLILLDDAQAGDGNVHVVPISGGGMVLGGASF